MPMAMAVTYINHQGSTRSRAVQMEVDQILASAECHGPALSAVHILSVKNCQADFLNPQQMVPEGGLFVPRSPVRFVSIGGH